MPTFAMIAVLLAAPAATDRSAASVEVAPPAAPVEAAASTESPAPAATPEGEDGPVNPWSSSTTTTTSPPPPPPAPRAKAVEPYDSPGPARKATPVRPDRPIRWRVDLLGAIGTTFLRDPSWRAFDDNRSAVHVSGTIRADVPLGGGRVFLGGGATFRRFTSSGRLYDAIPFTDVLVREPIVFARASIVAVEGVDVVVQAGGGPSVVDLGLSGSQSAYQRKVVAMVDGLAGLALYLPKRWLPRRGAARATGGLELGLGYTWRGNVDVRPKVSVGDEPIGTTSTSFGDLSTRGLTWRFGVFVRFM